MLEYLFLLRMQLVHSVVVLCPLEIRLDLANKRCAVTFSDIQLFLLGNAIFLEEIPRNNPISIYIREHVDV